MASKVHFPAEQVVQHDSEIVIQQPADDIYDVHLGFLEINHQYELRFAIRDALSEDLIADPLQNVHVRVLEVTPSEDGSGHDVLIDFSAYKEKLMKEQVVLKDSRDKSKEIKLVIHARVLGKGKGTPSLRSGIHCTGINIDEESENSDWQGFD